MKYLTIAMPIVLGLASLLMVCLLASCATSPTAPATSAAAATNTNVAVTYTYQGFASNTFGTWTNKVLWEDHITYTNYRQNIWVISRSNIIWTDVAFLNANPTSTNVVTFTFYTNTVSNVYFSTTTLTVNGSNSAYTVGYNYSPHILFVSGSRLDGYTGMPTTNLATLLATTPSYMCFMATYRQ